MPYYRRKLENHLSTSMNEENEIPAEIKHRMQLELELIGKTPEEHPSWAAMDAFRQGAIKTEKRIYGQINVESEDPVGVNMLLCAYPSGDCYYWFILYGYYILVVLVNEKVKCLAEIPVLENEEFLGVLNQATNGINIKNGYPVENPDNFTPIPQGTNPQENPPESGEND